MCVISVLKVNVLGVSQNGRHVLKLLFMSKTTHPVILLSVQKGDYMYEGLHVVLSHLCFDVSQSVWTIIFCLC